MASKSNRVLILEGDEDRNFLCCQRCEREKGREFQDAHPEIDSAPHGSQCDYCGAVECCYKVTDPMPRRMTRCSCGVRHVPEDDHECSLGDIGGRS